MTTNSVVGNERVYRPPQLHESLYSNVYAKLPTTSNRKAPLGGPASTNSVLRVLNVGTHGHDVMKPNNLGLTLNSLEFRKL